MWEADFVQSFLKPLQWNESSACFSLPLGAVWAVTVTLAAGTDARVGRAGLIFRTSHSRAPEAQPRLLREPNSSLRRRRAVSVPCCRSVSAAMPCTCAAAGNAQGPCSSVLFSQVPEAKPWQKVPSQPVSLQGRVLEPNWSRVLLQSAGMYNWSITGVPLEYHWSITAAPAATLGWARAPGLALDLCVSNSLAYQAEGVQALKFGQNMIIRSLSSATCRRSVCFPTAVQDDLFISFFHVICLDLKGFKAVTLLHKKIQSTWKICQWFWMRLQVLVTFSLLHMCLPSGLIKPPNTGLNGSYSICRQDESHKGKLFKLVFKSESLSNNSLKF